MTRARPCGKLCASTQALGTVEHILAHQHATADQDVAPQHLSLYGVVKETLKHIGAATAGVAITVGPSVENAPDLLAHQPIAVHVLHNLLNNALTAVRAAHVSDPTTEISARYEPESRHVVLQVADNGIGIAQDNLQQIFRNGFATKTENRGREELHWCAYTRRAALVRVYRRKAPGMGPAPLSTSS